MLALAALLTFAISAPGAPDDRQVAVSAAADTQSARSPQQASAGGIIRGRIERSGYLALSYGQRRPGEQGRPLEIAEGDVADKVDFALPRLSVISGRVFDEAGQPIAGVTVWIMQSRYVQGQRQFVPTGASGRTDITGRYRVLPLSPGDYTVLATIRETWPDDTDPTQVYGYAPTYFPGTSVGAQAQRVKLGVAQEISSIDFNRRAPPVRLSQARRSR
jgi:hypothetical protein